MSRAEQWVAALVLGGLVVIGVALLAIWPIVALATDGERSGRSFYVASESMLPTLEVNDRIIPHALGNGAIRSGTVVAIAAPDVTRLYRVVGVGGDRVAGRSGTVMLNGRPAALKASGRGPIRWERLPGEAAPHRIMDLGPSLGDDFAEVQVPAGRLFLLGDNRDRSADSRFADQELGVGLVDRRSVIGTIDVVLRRTGWRYRALPIDAVARSGDAG